MKVKLAKSQMSGIAQSAELPSELELSQLHSDKAVQPDNLLPATGVPLELERSLSAQYIDLHNYGTRAQTGVIIDHLGTLNITEVSTHDLKARQFRIEGFWNSAS